MDDLVEAPPTTALDAPLGRQRPNQIFQGVLAFFAVVGIGAAVTVLVRPPLQLRVITVERRLPPVVEVAPPRAPAPGVQVASRPPPPPATRVRRPPPAPRSPTTPPLRSDDCHDPLCGLGDLKR